MIPDELKSDIEHVANGQWYMVLAKGVKRGNHTRGFKPVSLMEEQEFKDFVKKLLTTGIKAGIDYAKKHNS